MKGSVGKKIMGEEMENSNVIMGCFWQGPVVKKQRENTEENGTT